MRKMEGDYSCALLLIVQKAMYYFFYNCW